MSFSRFVQYLASIFFRHDGTMLKVTVSHGKNIEKMPLFVMFFFRYFHYLPFLLSTLVHITFLLNKQESVQQKFLAVKR